MKHKRYIAKKRAKITGISGAVNIPYGAILEAVGDLLCFRGEPVCVVTSRNAHVYFACDDDGMGKERGQLTDAIVRRLQNRDADYQRRWDLVWRDPLCNMYTRPDHDEFWVWNHQFYHAPICNLQYIYRLISVGGE